MTARAMRRSVLVVDDDASIRAVVRAVLEADDLSVAEAVDGSAALAFIAQEDPAVVLLDVMMPGMDGIDVCRQIDTARVPVLMLTAKDDPVTERACLDAGARALLGKPFSAIELLDAVEGLLQVEAP
ncbi:MAG: response regulator [Acidimicrobiales bacterium]